MVFFWQNELFNIKKHNAWDSVKVITDAMLKWQRQIFSHKLEQMRVKIHLKQPKNTEKWFSRNISGKTCLQAICIWATLIQVNQDNSASV